LDNYAALHPVEQRFSDLFLCYCGYESCKPLHAFGPSVRPNYLIHFVLSGKGTFRTRNASFSLHEGEGFLIEPEVQTFYQADKDDPWTYLWVGFGGSLSPSIMRLLGLGGEKLTFRSGHGEELKTIVADMLREHNLSAASDFFIESQLCLFFSTLLKDIEITIPFSKNKENAYVKAALQYIQNHFHEPMRVEDIAEYIGIHRSYLYTLFHEEMGVGPQQYLQTFRLSRAADLLNHTTYPIEVIALSSGYKDPLVFSKAFKSQHGVTPTAYRNRSREDVSSSLENSRNILDSLSQ